jgi:hypothetical protein
MDIVLGSTTVLADTFERITTVCCLLDFKSHAAGGFVEDRRTFFDFLADFTSAGLAHPGANHVVK